MNQQVVNILMGIGELQSDAVVLDNDKLQGKLKDMRTTALALMEMQGRMNHHTIEGYRKDAIDQMLQLGEMISACRSGVYDRALFDIGLAAENLAKRIQHVFTLRNQVGLQTLCEETSVMEETGNA